MNDEKYMYFTERIQNTLVKPEILTLMNSGKSKEEKDKLDKEEEEKKKQEDKMSKEELFLKKQADHERRKKERTEKLAINQHQQLVADPQFQKTKAVIEEQKEIVKKTTQMLQTDKMEQKDSLQQRLAARRKKM